MSLISSVNIAQQALAVNQAAITTVSNNIANVDTEGYSKLRVDQAEVVNTVPTAGNPLSAAEACNGVKIASVTRYSDWYLQNYYWQESSTNSYLEQATATASNVEDLVNELKSTGLSSALDNFYTAVNALSNAPSDITARQNYVNAAQTVCSVFNNMSTDLTDIKTSLVGSGYADGSLESSELTSQVDKVNTLLDQLANVNFGIIKTNTGGTSSASLLDQRDLLLSQLSDLIPVDIQQYTNGTVQINLANVTLVKGTEVKGNLLATATGNADNPVSLSIVDPEDSSVALSSDITSNINSGSIGGLLDTCGTNSGKFTIYSVIQSLNTMASEFSTVLNKIQVGDINGDGTVAMAINQSTKQLTTSTDLMFVNGSSPNVTTSTVSHATLPGEVNGTVTTTAGGTTTIVTTRVSGGNTTITTKTQAAITAANISVNSNIVNDPYLVAAARVADPTATGVTSATGNNANMSIIMNSRNNSSYYSNLGGTTLEKYLANTVFAVGAKVEDLNTRLENQTLVVNQVKNNLQSKVGVNMDEELTDLIKYQRAYQAAARIYNVCNSLLEELVRLGQ